MKKQVLLLAALAIVMVACKDKNSPSSGGGSSSPIATFENAAGGINLVVAESNWFGADKPADEWNSWKSGNFTLQTYYTASYKSAWVVTNETSTSYKDFNDAYRSACGGAYEGKNYAVWNACYYGKDTIKFAKQEVKGVFINNNVYAVNSMCKGDAYAKKFTVTDFFHVTAHGVLDGAEISTATFALAENGEYVNQWTYFDLSKLGEIDGIFFTMNSSDVSGGYMNTPAYFCIDNLGAEKPADYIEPARAKFGIATFENEVNGINLRKAESNWFGADEPVSEWNSWSSGDFGFKTYYVSSYKSAWVVTNETSTSFVDYNDAYRSASGGAYSGKNYAVWNACYYGTDTIKFEAQTIKGVYINNNVYAVNSMCNGDAYAKKFTVTDFFHVTAHGILNGAEISTVTFPLAENGEYVNKWTYFDLSILGNIDGIVFTMQSSDMSYGYMNTPQYFCIDDFGAECTPGYVAPARAKFE